MANDALETMELTYTIDNPPGIAFDLPTGPARTARVRDKANTGDEVVPDASGAGTVSVRNGARTVRFTAKLVGAGLGALTISVVGRQHGSTVITDSITLPTASAKPAVQKLKAAAAGAPPVPNAGGVRKATKRRSAQGGARKKDATTKSAARTRSDGSASPKRAGTRGRRPTAPPRPSRDADDGGDRPPDRRPLTGGGLT